MSIYFCFIYFSCRCLRGHQQVVRDGLAFRAYGRQLRAGVALPGLGLQAEPEGEERRGRVAGHQPHLPRHAGQ